MSKKQKLPKHIYEQELERLQLELVYVQRWANKTKARIVIIFEGRDAAGKGGVIKSITERLNPRTCRTVALPVPTEKEKTQWYFQRYVAHLPSAGEIVIFDRSWYNRAGVERVMGFCTEKEHEDFMRDCPDFEAMLIRSGIILIKYWFSVSAQEQKRRFQSRISDPSKNWKISPMDMQARQHWVDYSRAKDTMLRYTDTKLSPWYIVDSDDKAKSRINCISHLLTLIPYEIIPYEKMALKPLQRDDSYIRKPMSEQTWIPDVTSALMQAEDPLTERKKAKKKANKKKKAKKKSQEQSKLEAPKAEDQAEELDGQAIAKEGESPIPSIEENEEAPVQTQE